MPRVTKDTNQDNKIEKKKTTKKLTSKETTATKPTTSKKTAPKKMAASKKTATKKATTSTKATTKKATTTKEATAKKPTGSKKTVPQKTAASRKTTTKKTTTSKVKKLENNIIAEYYDLPYRYNETIVKILYQTPTVLFVYWDISDSDREKFLQEYGPNFFEISTPILKIFNLTKNYNFEIEINDFANSWYIQVQDANCDYKVELGRRINNQEVQRSDYIYVSSSNQINFPNDHILLEELPDHLRFKNVKTNQITIKDIRSLHLIGINKVHNIHEFYKKFYRGEILEEINHKKFLNPSSLSSSWI